jgi:LuxR family maltose regulon positive regulatory protein
MYERALRLATDEQGQRLPIAGMALIGLGELRRQRDDLEAAARYLQQGIELSQRWSEVGIFDGYIALARVQFAQGAFSRARETMDKAQELAVRFDTTQLDDILVGAHRARLLVALEDLSAAMRWAAQRRLLEEQSVSESTEHAGPYSYYLREVEYMTLARLYLAQDQPNAALELLGPLQVTAKKLKREGSLIELSILRALALQAQGRTSSALKALERALTLAQPENYVRIFVDEREPMAQLLYEAARRQIMPTYAGQLLAAFPDSEPATERQESLPDMVEPLSNRELEVLALIAEGLSNQEVAQRLFISLRTVKWHSSNIYGKLGVSNRTQAVVKARTLGILPID